MLLSNFFENDPCVCVVQVEVLSDDEEEEEEEVVAAVDDKYKPASLEKMVSLIALLVEKSRDEERLQLSHNDFNAVAGGKVGVWTLNSCIYRVYLKASFDF